MAAGEAVFFPAWCVGSFQTSPSPGGRSTRARPAATGCYLGASHHAPRGGGGLAMLCVIKQTGPCLPSRTFWSLLGKLIHEILMEGEKFPEDPKLC